MTWIQDAGVSRCRNLDILNQDPGCRILDSGSWILNLKALNLYPGSRFQDLKQDPGCIIDDPGFRIRDPASMIQDPGFLIQDLASSILDPASFQSPNSRDENA